MRKTKVRVWDKIDKRMIKQNWNIREAYSLRNDNSRFSEHMLFTGIADKNNIKIYSGDIIDCFDSYGKYQFRATVIRKNHIKEDDSGCNVCIIGFSIVLAGGNNYLKFPNPKWHQIEVIGNIYKNKGLLDNGK